MLGSRMSAFTMTLFLMSTKMLYLVFCIGGEAALFIHATNIFWMRGIVVTGGSKFPQMLIAASNIGLLGWLRATSWTHGMSAYLLTAIVIGGSWCIVVPDLLYLGIAVYPCRVCSVPLDHHDLQYCKSLGLSISGNPPEASSQPTEACLSVACTLLLTLIVA